MNNGKYIAKALGGRFGKAETGTAGVSVDFEIVGPSNVGERISWIGWLSEKAYERTVETLVKIGYDESQGSACVDGVFTLPNPKEFELVIEHEAGIKNPEKTYPKVKFVNDLNFNKFEASAPEKLGLGFDLKKAMAAARAKMGVKPPSVNAELDKEPAPF